MAFDITIHRSPPSSNPRLPPPSFEITGMGKSDEQARSLKRPRLMWTPELHKRFLDALTQLGMENAVPKKILQHMRVDGLTRENVSSHLQKYRLYLKRMQGLLSGEGGNASLDARMPASHHFLDWGGQPLFQGESGENHLPSMRPGYHQRATVAVETPAQQQQSQQHLEQMGPFVLSPGGKFNHKCLVQQQEAVRRMVPDPELPGLVYMEDLDPGEVGGRR